MKKLFFIYLLFQTILFGCATCQLMIPTAEIQINLQMEKKKVNNIHIEWHFADLYSAELLKQYDKNRNQILDNNELKAILGAMLDYLKPKEMLTKIQYSNNDSKEPTIIKPKYENFDIQMISNFLVFTYDSEVNIEIKDKSAISLAFEDNESYFSFVTTKINVSKSEFSHHSENLYLFTASVLFSNMQSEPQPKEEIQATSQEANQTKIEEIAAVKKEESLQANILKESITKIKSLFESIKDEKNPLTYLFLLFFAYIYGVIHALGPGHGKTLVASYFLSNERSYSKALFVSLAIGVVHTFSAFLLTLVIYFFVNTFLAQFLNDTVFYTTKISAVIIIIIALYLIYQKYKAYKKIANAKKSSEFKFSTTPHVSTCGCASCKVDSNSTDMALIISAGIIPCPGTVTIFIFSLSLGLYYAGFLSAFVMSLGMSTIIFFSAILSVAIRKKTADKNSNLKKYLEYASLSVILILGFILLFT
ncbi:MAG: DUF1007 family protein [Sulfurimonas sp.]|jgi:ABC-type nickel/cobalt efflux system permease component RcnA